MVPQPEAKAGRADQDVAATTPGCPSDGARSNASRARASTAAMSPDRSRARLSSIRSRTEEGTPMPPVYRLWATNAYAGGEAILSVHVYLPLQRDTPIGPRFTRR